MSSLRSYLYIFLFCSILGSAMLAQETPLSPTAHWASTVAENYLIYPDQTYGTANNYALKLDVWQRKDAKSPNPTLIYIHGGGWIFGDRTGATLMFLPYIEMGWNVVNVEYRMASASPAPAAVEDCRCALRWVYQHAKQFNIDTGRLVLTGHSAGGHLSLITGMLPDRTSLDNDCYGEEKLKVAAIINWFGPTDVVDLMQGPNLKNYALMWVGSQANGLDIAKKVSPLTYVRAGLPPVLTVHGDKDDVVPYDQALRLHQALTQASVPNELVTIKGGAHWNFGEAQEEFAYRKIRAFLKVHGLGPVE